MKVRVALDYSSNFKINLTENKLANPVFRSYKVSKKVKQAQIAPHASRIVCKHAIFMLMHLHNNANLLMANRSSAAQVETLSFFFKPSKSKYFTLLRAPYRYKIARNQILFKRFFFRCSVVLRLACPSTSLSLKNSYRTLEALDSTLTALYKDLDTNICTQNRIQLSVPFSYTNFFLIKHYR